MADPVQTTAQPQPETCPACGYRTLVLPPDRGEQCPACGWINDFQQLVHPDIAYGANAGLSLQQAQQKAKAPLGSGQAHEFERDPAWRPLQPGENPAALEAGGPASPVCFLATPDPADYVPYWLRITRTRRPSGG